MDYALTGEGSPSVLGNSQGNSATATYSAPMVGNGFWLLAPSLIGPFSAPPRKTTVNTGMAAHTALFDDDVDSSTGDFWRFTTGASPPDYTPLTLAPGQSGKITVTFTPQGKKGDKVSGVLYVDDADLLFDTGNEQIAFPYSYKIK